MSLQFLSFVTPAEIPMYLSVGPSLEVYTGKESTGEWFSDVFTDAFSPKYHLNPDTDCLGFRRGNQYQQSDVGVLLEVDGQCRASPTGSRITELLIYAGISSQGRAKTRLPTPPRSSSPGPDTTLFTNGMKSHAKLFALPLSSDLTYHASHYPALLSPPMESLEKNYAQFLNPVQQGSTDPRTSPQKRLRVDSLFENATQQRKRTRRRGGEGIAHMMAGGERLTAQVVDPNNGKDRASIFAGHLTQAIHHAPPKLSRMLCAPSMDTLQESHKSRPLSRGCGTTPVQRSSLHRAASIAAFDSSSPAPDGHNIIEQQNRSAFTRMILAGMRLYGLQQKRKPIISHSASELLSYSGSRPASSHSDADEDEYKSVYHQTFKSTILAFRKHLSSILIRQDLMRETVDRLLAIFCTDPLDNLRIDESLRPEFSARSHDEIQHSFDSPSGSDVAKTVAYHHLPTPIIESRCQDKPTNCQSNTRDDVSLKSASDPRNSNTYNE